MGALPLASPTSPTAPPPNLTPAQLLLPTSALYAAPPSSDPPVHKGPFADERAKLDWSYHKLPTGERAQLQDAIVCEVLKMRGCGGTDRRRCDEREIGEDKERIALFTAGGMGAGKGHTLRHYLKSGEITLPSNFVWVDPDSLTLHLPERAQYLAADPATTSRLLHPEASLLQEILSHAAQTRKRSLVIDGSLSDCAWNAGFMRKLGERGWAVEILFVFAAEETMLCRAKRRAEKTGRVTDPESIKRSRLKSPTCVSRLSRKDIVRRVRLAANTTDSEPPEFVYDSELDPHWTDEGYKLDVLGFVEGRLKQGADGVVQEVEGQQIANGRRALF